MICVQQLIPKADWLTVRPDKVEKKTQTDSGLVLPDNSQEVMVPMTGTVVACGPDVKRATEGERVMFSPYAGGEYNVNGETLKMMQDREIIAGI